MHSTRLSERHLFPLAGPPNNKFLPEWPINRGLAVEMALRGRNDGTSATTVLPALGAWKPAKGRRFPWPQVSPGEVKVSLTPEEFTMLIGGMDLQAAKSRPWYRKEIDEMSAPRMNPA